MKKSKVALIIAAILVGIGTVGAIGSGVVAVPTVINEVEDARIKYKQNQGEEIYKSQDLIENLDINSVGGGISTVELKKSDDNLFKIKAYNSQFQNIEIDTKYDSEKKTLNLNTNLKSERRFLSGEGNFFKRLYDGLIYSVVGEGEISKITVEVPKGINVSLNAEGHVSLITEDASTLKDTLKYKSYSGYCDLPKVNNLKNINIQTNSYISMDFKELINAENVEIFADNIDISTNGLLSDYKDVKKLPSNVTLKASSVKVKSYMPIGQNVNINTNNYFEIVTDIHDYNVNGKIEMKNPEHYNDYDDYDDYNDYDDRDDRDDRDNRKNNYFNHCIKGLNIQAKDNKFEGQISNGTIGKYNMNITSNGGGRFENITRESLETELMMHR